MKHIYKNKKGALELSLNLIIMLIIGLVVLGLIIGAVQNILDRTTSSLSTQLDEEESKQLERLQASSKNLDTYPSRELQLDLTSNNNKIFIKLRNYGKEKVEINPGPLLTDGNSKFINISVFDETGTELTDSIAFAGTGFSLEPGQNLASSYIMTPSDQINSGETYFLVINYAPPQAKATSARLTMKVE